MEDYVLLCFRSIKLITTNNHHMIQVIKKLRTQFWALSLICCFISLHYPSFSQEGDKTLLGAGSTFINPLFSKMFAEYNSKTGIQVNYQSIGSGGGILQLTNKTVDFGASDAPLNDEQTTKIGAPALHIPMASGAVVLTYNLPGVNASLK